MNRKVLFMNPDKPGKFVEYTGTGHMKAYDKFQKRFRMNAEQADACYCGTSLKIGSRWQEPKRVGRYWL
jgi:hypothetical protein